MEEFISGYCRSMDASRMVAVEEEDGQWEIDCCYGSCPYEPACQIAEKVWELIKQQEASPV